MELERIALHDEYFIERKLYPNVDFYSGITLKAMGFPTSMFTVLFAVARTVGWIAQWKEMIEDPVRRSAGRASSIPARRSATISIWASVERFLSSFPTFSAVPLTRGGFMCVAGHRVRRSMPAPASAQANNLEESGVARSAPSRLRSMTRPSIAAAFTQAIGLCRGRRIQVLARRLQKRRWRDRHPMGSRCRCSASAKFSKRRK